MIMNMVRIVYDRTEKRKKKTQANVPFLTMVVMMMMDKMTMVGDHNRDDEKKKEEET